MGRGRAKAKQTKVAREIKYSSGNIDIDRLAKELAAERAGSSPYSTSTTDELDGELDDEADEDDADD